MCVCVRERASVCVCQSGCKDRCECVWKGKSECVRVSECVCVSKRVQRAVCEDKDEVCFFLGAPWVAVQPCIGSLHGSGCVYNTLQHTATHCNTLHHTATHCNTLQRMQ